MTDAYFSEDAGNAEFSCADSSDGSVCCVSAILFLTCFASVKIAQKFEIGLLMKSLLIIFTSI